MTYTKQWLFTKNSDETLYQSSVLGNKIQDLIRSGDIVSINNEEMSANQTKLTMVFKDEDTWNSFDSWIEINVREQIISYNATNSITVEKLQ